MLNGAYFKNLRRLAKRTLTEMARICRVSAAHLSRMERGDEVFQSQYAVLYEAVLERRRRSGDEGQDGTD